MSYKTDQQRCMKIPKRERDERHIKCNAKASVLSQQLISYTSAQHAMEEEELQELADVLYEEFKVSRLETVGHFFSKEAILRAYIHAVRTEKEYRLTAAQDLHASFLHSLSLMHNPAYFSGITKRGQVLLKKWSYEGVPPVEAILKDIPKFQYMLQDLSD